jgi:hypothetical protein
MCPQAMEHFKNRPSQSNIQMCLAFLCYNFVRDTTVNEQDLPCTDS